MLISSNGHIKLTDFGLSCIGVIDRTDTLGNPSGELFSAMSAVCRTSLPVSSCQDSYQASYCVCLLACTSASLVAIRSHTLVY